MLTDTHCHLFYEQIKNDLESVLERARKLGVNRFICVATNLDDAEECLSLAKGMTVFMLLQAFTPMIQKMLPATIKKNL